MKTKTLHFRPVNISRNKAVPDNAVKACAYRSGLDLYDDKEHKTQRYGNRAGILQTEIFAPENAPDWMRDDFQIRAWERFGNEIEKIEDGHNRRASAMLGKDFQAAAPRELTHEQNWAVAKAFAKRVNERGLAVAVGFHEADASDGEKNPHFHFFVPMREVSNEGFGKRYRSLDAKGKGKENPELKALRHEYYQCVNDALAAAGVEGIYYDPEKQEDKEPGVHLGKNATALEKKGEKTRVSDRNRRIGNDNFMRQYEQSAGGAQEGWFLPPTVEKENLHKRFAEWQLLRGAAMASRDATQKSQSSITTPPANRSEKATDRVREGAKLAVKQSLSYQARVEQSRNNGPDRSR